MALGALSPPWRGLWRDRIDRISKRFSLGKLCLKYVNWRDSRREVPWVPMSAPLSQDASLEETMPEGLNVVSLAETGDVYSLTRMHNRAYIGASDYRRAGWVEAMALQSSRGFDPELTWLAVKDGEPVGFCMARVRRGEGWITGIGVSPQLRRQGIGTALLRHAMSALAARGETMVRLEVAAPDAAPQALYKKQGFQPR